MELIQSFCVDHTLIVPGIFTSRTDIVGGEPVTTYDIRLKKPKKIKRKIKGPRRFSGAELEAKSSEKGWKTGVFHHSAAHCRCGLSRYLRR